MLEWRRARDEVLKLAEAEAEARRARDDLAGRRDRARASLAALLPATAGDPTLAAAVLHAEAACGDAEAALAAHRRLAEAAAREADALPSLRLAATEAAQALSDWRCAWATAVPALGLPPDGSVEAAEAALDAWKRIAEAAPAWRSAAQRVADMGRNIADFAQAVRGACARLGDPPSEDAPVVAAARLVRRLADARQAAGVAGDLARRIAAHDLAGADAARRGRDAEARLAALREAAGVADEAGLALAIDATRRRAAAKRELGEALRDLIAQGDGRDEAALRSEAAGGDIDKAVARLAEIEQAATATGERFVTLSEARANAARALADMEAGRDAAAAAQEARHALADAQAAAERYARLHVAGVLLRSGIERFRRVQQGPMLAAAGTCFAALTGGRYARLGVDEDAAGRPRLLAVRDDATECPVEALSEGTRDQLYLALRVAAIEAYSAGAEPLPFVADDLLVHFDDARASAAMRVLARLGRTTQVVLFTHHDHVAALAATLSAAQADAGVVVRRLPDAAPARGARAAAELLAG